jgi:CheY-like chemotaxis protein
MYVDVDLRPLSVLVVDGSQYARSHLKSALQSFGIRNIQECADGPAAIAILKEGHSDLVLVDRDITPMDGVAFTRFVRTGGMVGRNDVPIIVIAAEAEMAQVMVARNAGVTEFMVRPFSTESLYRRLRATVVSPRPFVRAAGYVGPCRRTVERALPQAGERRHSAPLPRPAPLVRSPGGGTPAPRPQKPGTAERTSRKKFKAGEIIFGEGARGDEAYVVETGRVAIYKTVDGHKMILGELGPNGIFGEMALIDDEPRMASAMAEDETTCIVIPKSVMKSQVDRTPELVILVLDTLLDYIRRMGRDLVQVRAVLNKDKP